jgi:uroporphyrinogen decarboxylase
MDVQQVMPYGSADDVRAEVRRLVETFGKNGNRMIFSLGNAATRDIPVENLEAMYDEVYRLREGFK